MTYDQYQRLLKAHAKHLEFLVKLMDSGEDLKLVCDRAYVIGARLTAFTAAIDIPELLAADPQKKELPL